jgi:hypothetical protein
VSIASSTITYFRAQWALRFIDTCVVTRVTGTTFNNTTGQTEDTTAEVYSGPCLVRPANASESDFGEARRQEVDYDLFLPYTADDLATGDLATVVSVWDPEIPVLTVLRGFTDSYLTRRQYECQVIVDD